MSTAPHVCRASWWEIVRVFLTLGALSPGGPGLIGVLQTEVQEKRAWLSQARFVEGVAKARCVWSRHATRASWLTLGSCNPPNAEIGQSSGSSVV